jgi:hypothetical protein
MVRAPFSTNCAANYAACARQAIDEGNLDKARKSYQYYMASPVVQAQTTPADTAKLVLRWALLEQRALNAKGAVEVFKLGAKIVSKALKSELQRGEKQATREAAATLYCSWGLAEHRHRVALGRGKHAKSRSAALLRHAAVLDESKAPVLRWKRFATETAKESETEVAENGEIAELEPNLA